MRIWIAEQQETKKMLVDTSLPKLKEQLKNEAASLWNAYRCDVGKVDLAKVCSLLRKFQYEESRDNEITLQVDDSGEVSKAKE